MGKKSVLQNQKQNLKLNIRTQWWEYWRSCFIQVLGILNSHWDYVRNKTPEKINFIFRLKKKIPTIYKSTVAPHIFYCGTLLYMCNNEWMNNKTTGRHSLHHKHIACERGRKTHTEKDQRRHPSTTLCQKAVTGVEPATTGTPCRRIEALPCLAPPATAATNALQREQNRAMRDILLRNKILLEKKTKDQLREEL